MRDLDKWDDRLQSPITIYNINRPMRLAEFEELPKDLQREYIRTLRERYGFGTHLAAAMLGVTKDAFVARARALGVQWPKTLILLRVAPIAEAREKFLAGYVFPAAPKLEKTPAEKTQSNHAAEAAAPAEENVPFAMADYGYIRIEMHGSLEGVIARLLETADLFAGSGIKCTVESWRPHE